MVDERDLIKRSRQGDQRAFEELVGLKRAMAVRIALNIVGGEDDARDIAQQAFIRLWSSIRRFDERLSFDAWFFRIVVNLSIDFHRKQHRLPRPLPEGGEAVTGGLPSEVLPGADVEVRRDELRRIFNRLASGLAPAQRAVFILKEIEGLSTAEIAEILEVRPSTVRNHLHQARHVLREGLRRRYPEYFRSVKR